MSFALLALAVLCSPLGTIATPLTDWYVDAGAASCAAGNGTAAAQLAGNGTAAAPFCRIADAINFAVDGDSIYIAPGTYRENLNVDKDLSFIGRDGRDETFVEGVFGSVFWINPGAVVTIDGLTIQNGHGSTWVLGAGGGIYSRGTLTLRNSAVRGNSSPSQITLVHGYISAGRGGGLRLLGPTIVTDTIITGNRVEPGDFGGLPISGYGAGIFVQGTSLSLTNCTISNNWGGEGIYAQDATLRLIGSTVHGHLGRGLSLASFCDTVIRNSTIAFNGAGVGTALPTPDGFLQVEGSTFAGNASIGLAKASPVLAEVRNTIFANNQVDVSGTFVSLGHNFVGNAATSSGFGGNNDLVGTGTAPLDARLGSLAANGGPTATCAPLAGSPVIDAGDPSNFAPLDQRGYARVGVADIGAHEFGATGGTPIAGCASTANSTGAVGVMSAAGSFSVSDNSLTLFASSLPQNATAMFLTSRTAGFSPQPGSSAGNLCLANPIGRFVGPGQLRNTGSVGAIGLAIDLARQPTGTAFVPVVPGETWYFQAWHRDTAVGGTTSNFSAGTQVTFVQ